MTWTVATAAAHYFITCDTPVHRSIDPATVHPIYGDHGFLNKTAQVTFALSPKKLLLLTHQRDAAAEIVLPRNYVCKENRKRAFDADTSVYAHLYDRHLEEIVAAFKGKRPEIKTQGFDGTNGFGEIKVSRRTKRKLPPDKRC